MFPKITVKLSPGLIFIQKAFLLGLFPGELIFRGNLICISKCVVLDNKDSLKYEENNLQQLTLTVHGLIFWRAYYRKDHCVCDLGAYFWEGLLSEFYGIIPIISPGLILVQKGFLGGLFSGSLVLERLVIGRNFAFQDWLALTIKTALNNLKCN